MRQTTEAEIVTMHSFSVGGADYEQFVLDLTAMVESLFDEIEGLRQVAVLREHGTGRVAVLAEWESRASQVSDLRYSGFRQTLDQALLINAADGDKAQLNMFPTLWSLRDVDQESNLYLARMF